MSVKPVSTTEIRERKKKQARTSEITGTLGLAALTGTALATRRGQKVLTRGFKAAGKKVPERLQATPRPKDLSSSITPILATSAGIGSLGSFNFARYTRAEAEKGRKVKKSYEPALDMGTYGEEGIAKNWEPVVNVKSPEQKRARRAGVYETTANVTALGTGAAGVAYAARGQRAIGEAGKFSQKARDAKDAGVKSTALSAKADAARARRQKSSHFTDQAEKLKVKSQSAKKFTLKAAKADAHARKMGRRGTAVTGVALASSGAGVGLDKWRQREFGKSAFGVEHD